MNKISNTLHPTSDFPPSIIYFVYPLTILLPQEMSVNLLATRPPEQRHQAQAGRKVVRQELSTTFRRPFLLFVAQRPA